MRVAINGMGRIGRLLLRRLLNQPGLEIVAVNDIMPLDNLAYLLKYDSVYGAFPGSISFEDRCVQVNGTKIAAFQVEDPARLPWKDLDIDVVLECSGKFSQYAGASRHLEAGAKKVLLSTTGSDDIPLLIYGFNHTSITPDTNIV
ncbi:MAG TPA: glyceraldehyde 3-phosphate dehydrogenase NAD-binding domain-containing protein, partial [Chitinophagaceae bacterium]|nr:glyceraldehyde 3-phosphate dehydrogenase NAD-binding domain-containing protein [Chitinophagaceae bacterium]